ncbi:MAG: glycosyltransferase [Nannocystaceae bacterium]|nr:glycosyltransferase [Nannocystaceae bacterium]
MADLVSDATRKSFAALGSVTAVIPARNEAGAIAAVVAAARELVTEVIVVDDGSSDDTAARAAAAGARVVRIAPGRGKGNALRTGVTAAQGQTIVMLDGDGQDDPQDLPRLLERLAAGADPVVGTRFVAAVDRNAIAPLDRVGNRLLTALLNLLYGVKLTDTQAGFRAISRALWQSLPLTAQGFEIETEVLVRALQAGANVQEVAVGRRPRHHGERVLHRVRDGLAILGCMVRLRVS